MKTETVQKAIQLLLNHSNEDFVSKQDAYDCANELISMAESGNDEILEAILTEVSRAENKHPNWPTDLVYAATIVAEENGELTRACLQFQCENGAIDEVRKEAIQTAATCIRLLKNIQPC